VLAAQLAHLLQIALGGNHHLWNENVVRHSVSFWSEKGAVSKRMSGNLALFEVAIILQGTVNVRYALLFPTAWVAWIEVGREHPAVSIMECPRKNALLQ
jgi:hypothetical protein